MRLHILAWHLWPIVSWLRASGYIQSKDPPISACIHTIRISVDYIDISKDNSKDTFHLTSLSRDSFRKSSWFSNWDLWSGNTRGWGLNGLFWYILYDKLCLRTYTHVYWSTTQPSLRQITPNEPVKVTLIMLTVDWLSGCDVIGWR